MLIFWKSLTPRHKVTRFSEVILLIVIMALTVTDIAWAWRQKRKSCKRMAFNRHTTNYRSWREQMTVCELLDNYNPTVRPSGKMPNNDQKGPVIVWTSLEIRSIGAISERNMEWFDDRLRYVDHSDFRNFDFIHVAHDQMLWIPDTFFQNERNGWRTNLSNYALMEKSFIIADAYTTSDIVYKWDHTAITIDKDAKNTLPNFRISAFENKSCDSTTNTGTYSCLRVELRLSRVFSFFLLQLYIPSTMLVGVSWVSYWIDWKSTAARVPLAIVTLLTMITQSHAINSNLPPVSYTKAIDIWIGACVVFIFASLIEYAIVNYVGIFDEHREIRAITSNQTRLSNAIENDLLFSAGECVPTSPTSYLNSPEKKSLLRRRQNQNFELHEGTTQGELIDFSSPRMIDNNADPIWTFQDVSNLIDAGQKKRMGLLGWCSFLSSRKRAERIDIIARTIFPIAFILFNAAYWSIYLGEMVE
ncbi:Cation transporter family protein [Onchocerca flexuosa]|uniref:Cation transporter family protein n=1 Tax=Onchocerca flexuosa TaxID=387005 RepID=A0A238C328_9BILA|nr:Cation transporter family protein [Onchocerca flexuosa]